MTLVVSSQLIIFRLSPLGQVRVQGIFFVRQVVFVPGVVIRVGLELAVIIVDFIGLSFPRH